MFLDGIQCFKATVIGFTVIKGDLIQCRDIVIVLIFQINDALDSVNDTQFIVQGFSPVKRNILHHNGCRSIGNELL